MTLGEMALGEMTISQLMRFETQSQSANEFHKFALLNRIRSAYHCWHLSIRLDVIKKYFYIVLCTCPRGGNKTRSEIA